MKPIIVMPRASEYPEKVAAIREQLGDEVTWAAQFNAERDRGRALDLCRADIEACPGRVDVVLLDNESKQDVAPADYLAMNVEAQRCLAGEDLRAFGLFGLGVGRFGDELDRTVEDCGFIWLTPSQYIRSQDGGPRDLTADAAAARRLRMPLVPYFSGQWNGDRQLVDRELLTAQLRGAAALGVTAGIVWAGGRNPLAVESVVNCARAMLAIGGAA